MNNKSKPSAFPAFGIRGAKVMPFLEMTKQNVNLFYFHRKVLIYIKRICILLFTLHLFA